MRQRGADDARLRRQHHRQRLRPGLFIAGIVDRNAHGDAGIVDDNVERAEMRSYLAHDALDRVAIGDIEGTGPGGAAAGCDLVGYGPGAVRAPIRHRDMGAFIGEYPRRGGPHPARGARDQYGQSLYRTAELLEVWHDISLWRFLLRTFAPSYDQTNGKREGWK